MIIDTLENSGRYSALSKSLKEAFHFLESTDLKNQKEGTIELNGRNLYCTFSTQHGRKAEEAKLEFHRNYIDIHFTISGNDSIGWKSLKDCKNIEKEYDGEKDFGLFSDLPKMWITVEPGHFAIFFPEDAHAPLVSDGEIHKVVIKIAINEVF